MKDSPDIAFCHCEGCPLRGGQKVLGEGTHDKVIGKTMERPLPKYGFTAQAYVEHLERDYQATYEVAVVAISPVDEELRQGRPMVGWSGQLIRESLQKVGLKDYYLTNALLCNYPDGMTHSQIIKAGECCRDRLVAELKRVKTKLVIVMGNVPLEVLTQEEYKITSVQGTILPLGDF